MMSSTDSLCDKSSVSSASSISLAVNRPPLQQMATIDLGSLTLETEDRHMLNRSKSQDCKLSYPSITIVQKKGYFYKTSPKERRKQFRKIRRSQSMDFEDTEDGHESRLFKLLSDSDIQESGLKTCDSRDIVVSDIFVKVPQHLV